MVENFRGILTLRLWVFYRSDPGSFLVGSEFFFLRRVSLSVAPEHLTI
jgi:hypothetical protein